MYLVNSPSPRQPTPGVVKQDKSFRGSIDTTKPRLDSQRVRMSSGQRPIGAAKGKQPNTEALCQLGVGSVNLPLLGQGGGYTHTHACARTHTHKDPRLTQPG